MTDGEVSGRRDTAWSLRGSLTLRIMAVNIIALGLLAVSLFYLDSYRNRLLEERYRLAGAEAAIAADALGVTNRWQRRALIARLGSQRRLRLRLYSTEGKLIADSFELGEPTFTFVDPAGEPWYQHAARVLDLGMDFLLRAQPVPDYREPSTDVAAAWPEVVEARTTQVIAIRQRLAPDRTPVITAAVPVGSMGQVLLTTRNAVDITQNVRDARQTLALIVGAALLVSILLSLFLARTIIAPLRLLVRAAIRVRLGREREVVVPRLPERRDEIGLLARAISDMTAALRQRIDAVESFAADVAHELKNPLASLRSAVETLVKVEDPELRRQLTEIAAHDVKRIDRLVTEIADASRIDAELSRTVFERIDLERLLATLVEARQQGGVNGSCEMTVTCHGRGPWLVAGDASQLERVFQNLLDNAVSFSPENGRVTVDLHRFDNEVEVRISDEGPGIPVEHRDKVFTRFHSLRPASEDFGNHSGLGLGIARTIVEAHDGSLIACDPTGGLSGACLALTMPAWSKR